MLSRSCLVSGCSGSLACAWAAAAKLAAVADDIERDFPPAAAAGTNEGDVAGGVASASSDSAPVSAAEVVAPSSVTRLGVERTLLDETLETERSRGEAADESAVGRPDEGVCGCSGVRAAMGLRWP